MPTRRIKNLRYRYKKNTLKRPIAKLPKRNTPANHKRGFHSMIHQIISKQSAAPKAESAMKIIVIFGGTGSGKSTLANQLYDYYNQNSILTEILSMDDYYEHYNIAPDRESMNYDIPDAVDWALYNTHVNKLKRGYSIEVPLYSYEHSQRQGIKRHLKPPKILILEGILNGYNSHFREIANFVIGVQTEKDVAIMRRAKIDVEERNLTARDTHAKYFNHIVEAYKKFILPYFRTADLLVHNNTHEKKYDIKKIVAMIEHSSTPVSRILPNQSEAVFFFNPQVNNNPNYDRIKSKLKSKGFEETISSVQRLDLNTADQYAKFIGKDDCSVISNLTTSLVAFGLLYPRSNVNVHDTIKSVIDQVKSEDGNDLGKNPSRLTFFIGSESEKMQALFYEGKTIIPMA